MSTADNHAILQGHRSSRRASMRQSLRTRICWRLTRRQRRLQRRRQSRARQTSWPGRLRRSWALRTRLPRNEQQRVVLVSDSGIECGLGLWLVITGGFKHSKQSSRSLSNFPAHPERLKESNCIQAGARQSITHCMEQWGHKTYAGARIKKRVYKQ